jgi:LmbE family N-acetylglucosaminyl deacetylase
MAVHAHPDDEAISTGGILARYSDEGVRTVLVTCTNGELGDAPGGIKPGDAGHHEDEIVTLRLAELRKSCEVLGIEHLELLGYHDSGMMGWPSNDDPRAFWHADVNEAAAKLAALMERYRPQVVVTYDENGFYGHPDHIQANRVTLAAAATTGIPQKLYYPAVSKGMIAELGKKLAERGIDPFFGDEEPDFLVPTEVITTVVDVAPFADRKFDSLSAHASQGENIPFLSMGRELFKEIFSFETFIRVSDRTGAALPEDDLFAGLR